MNTATWGVMSKSVLDRVLLLGMLCISLFLTGCGKSALYSGLKEKEANEIISILQQYGFSVEKVLGKENVCSVIIDKTRFSLAIEILTSKGYPKTKFETVGDVFKKSGLVSSPLEERVRFMYALGESVSATINQIPGVIEAKVHIVLPENDPYTEKATPSSAAVFVSYRPDSSVEEYVRDIKYLVANSIEGLNYDKVSVALFPIQLPTLPQSQTNGATMVNIAGLEILSSSKNQLYIIFGIFVAIVLVLFLVICIMAYRSVSLQKKAAEVEKSKPEAEPKKGDEIIE
ncbi:MAG: type III secretion inner membrane ring lipoprotein SctJ [Puniceicoccales bacterium]|jgi:type III secretion protein J|nr:type III secretion inner membrane ring lipoprotein SctJ [Puniceicoccales bacterium]